MARAIKFFLITKGGEQMEILTRAQELRRIKQAPKALENLVEAPESKDLIKSIELGSHDAASECDRDHERCEFISTLYLTRNGLMECDFGGDAVAVEPSVDLVKKYNLTTEALVDLLARLKA